MKSECFILLVALGHTEDEISKVGYIVEDYRVLPYLASSSLEDIFVLNEISAIIQNVLIEDYCNVTRGSVLRNGLGR